MLSLLRVAGTDCSQLLAGLAIALLGWSCEARTRAPAVPQRLLEAVVSAEIDRAPKRSRRAGLRRSGLTALVPSVQLASVSPSQGVSEERISLLAREGTTYRFALTLPEAPRLRFGLAFLPAAQDAPAPTAQHVLRLAIEPRPAESNDDDTKGGLERSVLLETTWAELAGRDWQDFEIDLGAWQGQEVVLLIECDRSKIKAGVVALSSPEIVEDGSREPGYDLLVISLDTLRADHLGSYGHSRPTSPGLDAFARTSYRFATAVSAAPWTRPAHKALFTGAYPSSIQGQTPFLAEYLWKAGYRTAAYTGGGMIDYREGFERGFEEFRLVDWIRDPGAITAWLDRTAGRKRFLFLHTYEIHDPYTDTRFAAELPSGRLSGSFDKNLWNQLGKELTQSEQAYIEALYDGDIAFTDEKLATLLAELEARGDLDRTIVVITSDHGEQFWEHGSWRHGQSLYDHQLLVPLMIRLPDSLRQSLDADMAEPGTTFLEQVSLVDLVPTLLELLDLEAPSAADGTSLVPLLRGTEWIESPVYSERVNIVNESRWSLRTRNHKLIHSVPKAGQPLPTVETFELFRLDQDKGENHNLAALDHQLLLRLSEWLFDFQRHAIAEPETELVAEELDPDLAARLRTLGYL